MHRLDEYVCVLACACVLIPPQDAWLLNYLTDVLVVEELAHLA